MADAPLPSEWFGDAIIDARQWMTPFERIAVALDLVEQAISYLRHEPGTARELFRAADWQLEQVQQMWHAGLQVAEMAKMLATGTDSGGFDPASSEDLAWHADRTRSSACSRPCGIGPFAARERCRRPRLG